jgi:hypothetical protein
MHLVCCLRHGDRVFETYWTTIRGVEAMDLFNVGYPAGWAIRCAGGGLAALLSCSA